jgi:hypothetical protein
VVKIAFLLNGTLLGALMSPLWVCQYSLKPPLATINPVADDAAENSTTAELAVVAAASTRSPLLRPLPLPRFSRRSPLLRNP